MSQSFFITSTGTEIGKTLVTSALCHQALEVGYEARAIKPIVSGYEKDKENDISILAEAQNLPITQENIDNISLYKFKEPISPDLAAKREGKNIDFSALLQFCLNHTQKHKDFCFIEGIGGVMVPLNARKTTLDLIDELNIPVILVTGTYLGSLSHTLTAINALEKRGIEICHLIISESIEPQVPIEEFITSLNNHINIPATVIPWIEITGKKWQNTPFLLHIIQGAACEQRKTG